MAPNLGAEFEGHEMGFGGPPFIKGKSAWRYKGKRPNMYDIEHEELFASIRSRKPINDGLRMAHSSLAGIRGRMAAYAGQEITWDMVLNSQENLAPAVIAWDAPAPVAPGHAGENKVHLKA